ncbi:MAG: hypothetical protein LAT62_02845 [Natronospirillum sp.]|uniref:hypothetical protein n=1 Tax=Natronospirillum sp. TaxID=2812955 RepID=UPI0025E368FF|nr:hypothetical protein [Natronospirillum sp.]MCH8550845.1 hypothetical protein [Natronospirillum sp.]
MLIVSADGLASGSSGSMLVCAPFAAVLCFVLLTPGHGMDLQAASPFSDDALDGASSSTETLTELAADSGVQGAKDPIDSLLRSAPGVDINPLAEGDGHVELWAFLMRDLIDDRLSAEDYRHAVRLVASQTGLTEQKAQERLATIVTQARQSVPVTVTEQATPEPVETTAPSSALLAFWIFSALLFGVLLAIVFIVSGSRHLVPVHQ